ncbi:MAG TPA: polymer-forming cytoskeletal protein [Terriglobales bacterium]|jgi:cytoskeletal protein CcmA (bactofilin family)|nr:polymer-forming cytoskeletal protein [Terriglobales bacterium]
MWKARPEEKPTGSAAPAPSTTNNSTTMSATPVTAVVSAGAAAAPAASAAPRSTFVPQRQAENFRAEVAHIGKSVLIKGELSGSEDLYLDGEVEGSVDLKQHSLTVGPHGRIRANIRAREVIVHGKVDGNIAGDEKVELKKSAVLSGDITTQRIMIEDGAFFKGAIDLLKDGKSQSGDHRRELSFTSAAGSNS